MDLQLEENKLTMTPPRGLVEIEVKNSSPFDFNTARFYYQKIGAVVVVIIW